MGTRARIAIANPDGTFTSIYTNYDGYPSGHGPTLRDHYETEEKVRALMALGDLSTLGKDLGECDSYARDRGETDVDAQTSADFEALCDLTQSCGGEYLYVFKGGNWFCAKGGVAFFGMPASEAPQYLEHINEVLIREAAQE